MDGAAGSTYRHMSVHRLCGALGAEIGGIDLAEPIAPEAEAEIRRAFAENLVIVFRDQDLAPDRQIAFTRIFGPCEQHPLYRTAQIPEFPEILVLEHKAGQFFNGRNDIWHADITFAETPPLGSVLHCRAIEEGHGDTMFANQCLAYDTLSPGMKAMLDGRMAEHSSRVLIERNNAAAYNVPVAEMPPPVIHPVVRTHPVTGRRTLFVNPTYTERFEHMTAAESKPILDYLYAWGTRSEVIYRHRWRVGDVVMFDNRCCWHYVVVDYGPDMHRLMHRTTARGDRPA